MMPIHGTLSSISLQHGESQFNVEGKIGGDASLSERGRAYADALPRLIYTVANGASLTVRPRYPKVFGTSLIELPQIWTSTLQRTIETARQLKYPKLAWKSLDELDAGVCDGMTYEEIAVSIFATFNFARSFFPESLRKVILKISKPVTKINSTIDIAAESHIGTLLCGWSP
jgi:6-phosphofructo-2-kinase/fructose-2,6-biphosphatase 2